jgi:hypothetical protein
MLRDGAKLAERESITSLGCTVSDSDAAGGSVASVAANCVEAFSFPRLLRLPNNE